MLNAQPNTRYTCSQCRRKGSIIVHAQGFHTRSDQTIREVRVEFMFDPNTFQYKSLAVIIENSLPEHFGSYILQDPIIRTEKRALTVGEALLSSLVRTGIAQMVPTVLNFDAPIDGVRTQLAHLEQSWQSGIVGTQTHKEGRLILK